MQINLGGEDVVRRALRWWLNRGMDFTDPHGDEEHLRMGCCAPVLKEGGLPTHGPRPALTADCCQTRPFQRRLAQHQTL